MRLVIDEARIPARHWHSVDLVRLRSALERGPAPVPAVNGALGASRLKPAFRRRNSGWTNPDSPVQHRAKMVQVDHRAKVVPADAFVVIGRQTVAPPPSPETANDNGAANARRSRARSVLRDALMLVLLAATVAGAFYSGRLHAMQKVIVVPPPANASNALT